MRRLDVAAESWPIAGTFTISRGSKTAAEVADIIIAEVNVQMPRTLGDSVIHVSDIDVMVLLDGPVDSAADDWACIRALYSLILEIGRPIDANPVDVADYARGEYGLYRNAQREGRLL